MQKISSKISTWVRSPTGPRTTHFWAPFCNFFFPCQALYDWNRDPEKISKDMQMVLVMYSTIFMRWAWRINPRSHLLAVMHVFNFSLQGRLLVKRVAWEWKNPEKYKAQVEFVHQHHLLHQKN